MVLITMNYEDAVDQFRMDHRIQRQEIFVYYAIVDGKTKLLINPGSVYIYSETTNPHIQPGVDFPLAIAVSDILITDPIFERTSA